MSLIEPVYILIGVKLWINLDWLQAVVSICIHSKTIKQRTRNNKQYITRCIDIANENDGVWTSINDIIILLKNWLNTKTGS